MRDTFRNILFHFEIIKITVPWHLPCMAFQHVTEQLVLNGNSSDLQLGGAQFLCSVGIRIILIDGLQANGKIVP